MNVLTVGTAAWSMKGVSARRRLCHASARRQNQRLGGASGLLLALAMSGCAHSRPTLVEKIPFLPQRNPDRMVVVLTPSRMEEHGQGSRQGMLCRVYFFHGEDPIPVRAKGDLVFTAFDHSRGGKNREPDGKYEIKADELASHLRKDIVGDSYLFWFPYEPMQKTQVSLQGTFQSTSGPEVQSGVVAMEMLPAVQNVAQNSPAPLARPVTKLANAKENEKTLPKL